MVCTCTCAGAPSGPDGPVADYYRELWLRERRTCNDLRSDLFRVREQLLLLEAGSGVDADAYEAALTLVGELILERDFSEGSGSNEA